MAKKLNKKIAVIGIILLALIIAGGSGMFIALKIHRSPDRAYKLYEQALERDDYIEAEKQLGRSYYFGETDADKVEKLFELADFHLIQNDQHEANWNKAMGSWNQIVTIDPKNIQARKSLLDYYYQSAESGNARAWRVVRENTTELIEALESKGTEPETDILIAHAKALLSIAQRGETTDRRPLLDECMTLLDQLIEQEPQNPELYRLMADATAVEGELNAQSGIIRAQEQARQKALGLLETSVEKADDKATAVADLMLFKMKTISDPNALEQIRAEIDKHMEQIQPNDKLWLVVSMAYETPGKMPAEAEINRAIEAIRQAHGLRPESFEYMYRMARLMYRKGKSFNDPAALDDALQIAEDALSLKEVQDVPGPLQVRSLNYRFTLNNFLADLYLEKALSAKESDLATEAENYIQKAENRIEEIIATLGVTDNPVVQKYQGLAALAKGEQGNAVRLLYRSYEQNKALDKPGEPSNVDSRVCIALAQIAEEQGQFGLQREFLEGAFSSKDRLAFQNPQLILAYADVLKKFEYWTGVKQSAKQYQARYGANEQAQKLEIEASIALDEFDSASELLSSYEVSPEEELRYELNILVRKVAQLKNTISSLKQKGEEPTSEQTKELQLLREQRNELLGDVLKRYPKELDPQTVATICVDMIQNEQHQLAVQSLDTFLAANPDILNLMLLRLKAQQGASLNATPEQETQLRYQAITLLNDEKQKAILLADYYRSQEEYEKAIEVLEENPQVDAEDPDIIQTRFDIRLAQKDFDKAESLQQIIRARNIDKYEGNLGAARLEIAKENYESALRRLDQCLQLQPLSSYIYSLKSRAQREMRNDEAAIESAKTALQMQPRNASYARQLASLLFDRNTALGSKVTVEQEAETELAIMRAILLNPADQQLQSVFAEVIQLRDPDRALLIRQRLMENNPSAANALMLGNMALRMAMSEWDPAKRSGLIELAGKTFEKGMEVEPDNQALLQAYADYQARSGKGEEAIKMLGDDENLLWKFYLRNSQFEQAETILNKLLQENPDDPMLIQGLVLASQGAGDREQVKAYLAMLSEKDNTKDTELWILQRYIDNGFVVEAEKKLASFKERYPEEKAAMLVEAWTEMGKGQLNDALALVNGYLATDTNNPGAWRLRGRLFRLMNQPGKAIEDLQRSKAIEDIPQVRMELATVYAELNQLTAAIGELVDSLENPQSPMRMRVMLEGLYRGSGRLEDLERLYQTTLEKYPRSVFWYDRAGVYYLYQNNFEKAQELLKTAWQISREQGRPDARALNGYLTSLSNAQQYDQVISVASGLIDTPLAPIAYTFMARVHFQRGQKEKATESFYTALDKAGTNDGQQSMILQTMMGTVGPDAVTAWVSRKLAEDENSLPAYLLAIKLAQGQGAYNKAIEYTDKCIDILGEESPDWLSFASMKSNLLIRAYMKTSDKSYLDRLMTLAEKMLELQPNNVSLLNNMAYLLADNDQQLETALDYSRKASQSDPGNPTYLDTYAYVQCKMGEFEKAEQNLIRALQIYEVSGQPVPWEVYRHFGMAREGLGKTEQAIEMYQKAIGMDQVPEEEKEQMQAAIERLQENKNE